MNRQRDFIVTSVIRQKSTRGRVENSRREFSLTYRYIRNKAEHFGDLMDEPFQCTSSWIQRFRARHDIVHGKISGESSSVDPVLTNDWLQNIWPKLREGYSDEDIYNAVETGLFFRLTPDHSLKFNSVLVAANMTGSVKKKLLVIGKSRTPRCSKNIKHMKNLPVDYDSIKKAWMTSVIWEATNY